MKKKITIILFILITTISYSQNKQGFLIGMNNSSISEGILGQIDISDKMGFHIGGFFEYDISNTIKFRPKLIYSQQGNRDDRIGSIEHINYKTNFLNVPLNFKFYDKTYFLVGPQIGYLLSEKSNLYYNKRKVIDIGINLGFGQKFNDFFVELNLNQGLTKTVDKPNYNGELTKGTNTVIQFSLGYYI